MAGQQYYQERMGAAGVRLPGTVIVAAPPQGADGAARRLAAAVDGAVGMAGETLARGYALEQRTRIDESLLEARREFSEWQAAYMEEHQGGNALEAEKDFSAKFAEIAERRLAAFGGADNEVWRRALGGRLAAEGLRATELGASYAARERAAWEDGVFKGRLAMLEQDAYTDPENGAWLDAQLAEILRDEEARGRDVTAMRRSLLSATQLARIRGLADRGDLEGASRLLAGAVSGVEGDFSTAAGGAGRLGASGLEARTPVQRAGESARRASGGFGVMLTPADAAAARALLERGRALAESEGRRRQARAGTAAAGFAGAAALAAADGDFSAATAVVEEVEGLDADAGRELRARLEARQTAFDVMRLHADRSLLEQGDAALKTADARATPAGVSVAPVLKDEVGSAVRQRVKAFRDDPAAFAAAARAELLTDDMTPAERTRRLLEAQATLGRGLNVAPRVLTRAQAAEMERAFTESEPQERLRLLTEMRAGYGPYFTAAAAESNLPAPVISLGATLDALPPSKAAVLLSAVTARESEISGVGEDTRAAARAAVSRLDFMRDLKAIARRFPGNGGARTLVASWEKMLINAALMGVTPEETVRHFDIAVSADSGDGGGYMLLTPEGSLPEGWDADDLAGAAEAAREVVLRRLTDSLPKGETPMQRRMMERGARHAAESGVWISAADGGSVHLVEESSGLPMTYADGAPVMFTLRELAAIVAERGRGATESVEASYNRLFERER